MRPGPERPIRLLGVVAALAAISPVWVLTQGPPSFPGGGAAVNGTAPAPQRHAGRGLVLQVDAERQQVVVSHDEIPGVMPAMAMAFEVRDPRQLNGLAPGALVSFTVVLANPPHLEGLRVVRYESVEQDPITARRLRLMRDMTRPSVSAVAVGQVVPDFTLTDQTSARVSLSQFRGRVIALNFVYTSCVLPQFCYRLANHFGVLQRRFGPGGDPVLLTVTFDPARDTPERLAEYGRQWNADPATWRFLTGDAVAITRVSRLFGLDAFPDEGLISHSTRTVVIDRQGRLAATIEGNQYTAAQLGDLVEAVLDRE